MPFKEAHYHIRSKNTLYTWVVIRHDGVANEGCSGPKDFHQRK